MQVMGYVRAVVPDILELGRIMRIAAENPVTSLFFCVQLAQRCSVVSPVFPTATHDVWGQGAEEQLCQWRGKRHAHSQAAISI